MRTERGDVRMCDVDEGYVARFVPVQPERPAITFAQPLKLRRMRHALELKHPSFNACSKLFLFPDLFEGAGDECADPFRTGPVARRNRFAQRVVQIRPPA